MDSSAADQDSGDPADSLSSPAKKKTTTTKDGLDVITVVPDGDVILDVTFETSKETLKAARKAINAATRITLKQHQHQQHQQNTTNTPLLKPKFRRGYRASLSVLTHHSKYFSNLLGDARFAEAKAITAAFAQLALRAVKPSEAAVDDLPVVRIAEDDEATQSAGQEAVFEDLLRLLHGRDILTTIKPAASANPLPYLAKLAVLADRFDCTAAVARCMSTMPSLKKLLKWPATHTRLSREDGVALTKAAEETLRQKILVAWLLDQPLRMPTATRELVLYGSRKWSGSEALLGEVEGNSAAWWDLPDDLERELQYRRECILNTIASVHRHFLQIYTSRNARQCKLGYDSSASCDSYQLGEAVKFLLGRNLLFFFDFSPASLDAAFGSSNNDYATADIYHVIATLKQFPGYQIDKNHTNCGMRNRILPILDYVQALLKSNVVSVARPAWSRNREDVSWLMASAEDSEQQQGGPKIFRFTRSMATDQRLRFEGAMAADRIARALFTADQWDWTPEE